MHENNKREELLRRLLQCFCEKQKPYFLFDKSI
jgi:hypothetical protein